MADSEKAVWWHVWIIVRSSDGTAELPTVTHSLLSRGFIVGPTARCMVTKHDDSPAVVVSLQLYRSPKNDEERKDYNSAGIRSEVVDAFKLAKLRTLAVIVSVESGMTTWALGSASMADDLKEAEAARQKLN